MRGAIAAALLVLAAHPAGAGPITDACGADVCAEIEEGLVRPGVSADDLRGDEIAMIEVADFYFAPRLAEVRDGQTVQITNTAPTGGNRHSVASADWGGGEPVLPVPGISFGGGAAFRSARLQPGTAFIFEIDLSTMDPNGYVALPGGDVLIPYFCYIHGASQMNGQLLVRR